VQIPQESEIRMVVIHLASDPWAHEALSGPVDHRGVERVVPSNSLPHHRNQTNSDLGRPGVSRLGCVDTRGGGIKLSEDENTFGILCGSRRMIFLNRNVFLFSLWPTFLCDLYCAFRFFCEILLSDQVSIIIRNQYMKYYIYIYIYIYLNII